ncbi:hypothetical protein [Clostridium sp. FP1]|uniref:hypothetical protein n=1 Tax=Clostridium sp. FP1 TaxID=2724076 RepID=UPI0013E90D1D|nr:hypothetical protein [Clostridium sp. FP1]MBZ9637723.1 hypothetical protein [Clostridium sp. FP1]
MMLLKILSNRNRSTKLKKCKELTGSVQSKKQDSEVKLNASDLLLKLTGIDINICSCCGNGKMITKGKLDRKNNSPPCEKNGIVSRRVFILGRGKVRLFLENNQNLEGF